MNHDLTIPELKALLAGRIFDLARELAPGGRRSGAYWLTVSPVRSDKRAGSFWVLLEKNPGVWKDEATGETGDVISLIQHCQRLASVGDTIKWARDWLGLARIDTSELKRRIDRQEADRRHEEENAALNLENQRRYAKAFWLECWATVGKTAGEVYLASRGIDVAALPRYPRALRFCPNMKHADRDVDGNRLETFWPGLVAAMTCSETGRFSAIHRTWLARDGSGKAPLEIPRKIWPNFKGAAIRIARGATELSPKEASGKGLEDTLAITEGLEDGLTLALACPELRVWAAGSLGNLASIKVPACSTHVIVCADNDWGKPQAERLLQKGLEALAAQRVKVSVARSRIGKDVNDCLVGGAAA